jgi:hypothetical protein
MNTKNDIKPNYQYPGCKNAGYTHPYMEECPEKVPFGIQ